jgi:glycosyltransferase involved in cell wall biosynthesis
LIRTLDPDIVHGQGTERDCAMSAVHSGYRNILTLHGNMRVHAARKEQRGSIYYRMAALLEAYCLKRTDGVVAISNYTNDLVKPLAKKTWLLPNAVDQRYFDIEATASATPRILFVGAMNERKNPIGLIKACEPFLRSGQCTIAFAGETNEQSDYGREFQHLLDTIPGTELLGFLDRDALGREFQRTSLLVLPTFEDNCPMVVLEAMAAGLPVAASRVGGVPDLINHEKDGVLFDPHHPVEMGACLEQLIQEPDTLNRLGQQARITARERFHPRHIAAEHLKIYRDLQSR